MTVKVILCLLYLLNLCYGQAGPDPWHYEESSKVLLDYEAPPDLKPSLKNKAYSENDLCMGEIYYRRLLGILLKGSHVQNEENGGVHINMLMRFDQRQWETLKKQLMSGSSFSEEIFRRSLGLIEESIYIPNFTQKIIITWSEYIQSFFVEYKIYITWLSAALGLSGALFYLWQYVSTVQMKIIIGLLLYMYEVFVSYKEVEQKEYEKFMAALNTCKWRFWSSTCDMPGPDFLLFIKHMNPLKIAIRVLATFITEPMIALNDTFKVMMKSITDGLWYPLDSIIHGTLMLLFNVILIIFILMAIVNYIFNIPMDLGIAGLLNLGMLQRNRRQTNNEVNPSIDNSTGDRISGDRLDRFLHIVNQAVNSRGNGNGQNNMLTNSSGIRRSASAGRLSNIDTSSAQERVPPPLELSLRRRVNGGGDAR